MEVIAKLKYLRIAPRKVRLVADLIRGKKIKEAQMLLDFSQKKATRPLRKLLDSAVANAKNNLKLEEKDLYILKITVDEGPKLKRWRPRARGRATEIQKKSSHITLVLKGKKKKMVKKEVSKAKPEEKPEKPEKKLRAKTKIPRLKREKRIKPKLKKKDLKGIFKRQAR